MIIKIPKADLDAIKFTCAVSDFLITEYTIENNFGLVQVEITELNGKELRPKYAFRIGQVFENRVFSERLKVG